MEEKTGPDQSVGPVGLGISHYTSPVIILKLVASKIDVKSD